MGKVSRRRFRAQPTKEAGHEIKGDMAKSVEKPSATALSRGQRRRMSKKKTAVKKACWAPTVKTTISPALKLKPAPLNDISSLRLALLESEKQKAAGDKSTTSCKRGQHTGFGAKKLKSRQRLAVHEMTRLQAVFGDPAFKSDAIASIQEHLRSTVGQ